MIIRRLEMRNWGPYAGDHTVEFAEPHGDRVIQLVRGENGHGKTHLLRALVIAFHGRDGMRIVDPESRARPRQGSALQHLDVFLGDALTNGTESGDAPQMRLAVELVDGEDVIEVQRSWWFDGRTPSEEQLVVTLNDVPYAPKAAGQAEQYSEKQALIQARIPENVIQFFFFDGEEIKSIAESNPTDEVTRGLDALLGFKLLDDLQRDVNHSRAQLSREEVAGKRATAEIQRLEAEITDLEATEEEVADQLAEEKDRALLLEGEIRDLDRNLPFGATDSGDMATNRADIATQIQERERERDNVRRRLADAVATNLALAYPADLATAAVRRLDGEAALRSWEQQRQLMAPECKKLSDRMYGASAPESDPPLIHSQLRFYRELLVQEWRNILQPPPAGVPNDEWFEAFSTEQLQEAKARLAKVATAATDDITTAVRDDGAIGSEIGRLRERLENYATDQASRALVDDIKDVSDRRSLSSSVRRFVVEFIERRPPPLAC